MKKHVITSNLSQTVELLIQDVIKLGATFDKNDKALKDANRKAIDAEYAEIAQGENLTPDIMKKARAAFLERFQLEDCWPLNDSTPPKKIGYNKARDLCWAGKRYNQIQAIISQDITKLEKELEEKNAVNLALQLDPDELKQHKETVAQANNNEKIASAFHNFCKHFETLHDADQAFQDLMKVAKQQQQKP